MRLITGGSGYLGIFLARRLVEKKIGVRVFDLNRSPLLSEKTEKIEFFKGDVRDAGAVSEACEGVTHVYHLAALIPQRKAAAGVMRAVHVGGTENVLRACVERRVEKMVFLSSSEAYGRMKIIPCPEDAPKNPLNEYGRNKIECEKLCERYAKEAGVRYSILRPPTLIGPEISEEGILLMLKSLSKGGVLPVIGGGKNRVAALDVRDCAEAVFICGERPEAVGQTFNVACKDSPTLLEIAEGMKKIAGTGVKVIRIPAAVGINALRLLNLFGLSPIMPDHYELLTDDFVLDTSKIRDTLGWKPEKSYMESSRDMYEWYLKENIRK